MTSTGQFTAWKDGDDYHAMEDEIEGLGELERSDRRMSEQEEARVMARFVTHQLPGQEGERDTPEDD